MKTINPYKILKWTLTLVVIEAISISLMSFGQIDYLGKSPSNPNIKIPITYNIGWWSHQDQLNIKEFKVKTLESNLNLFNAKSLLAYTIAGEIKYEGHWKPYIEAVHISERQIQYDSIQKVEAVVEITPIVKTKEDMSVDGGTISFNFTNEHIVNSMHWGKNRILFTCGEHETIIEVTQSK